MKKWKSIHIADRAALENFMALLARSGYCAFCGRALKDEISKLIGIGPNCAKNHHLPHDIAAANICLERRHQLLGVVAGDLTARLQ